MSGLYKYNGKLTLDAVAEYEQAVKQAREEAADKIRDAYLEVRQIRKDLAAAERKNERLTTENMFLKENSNRLAQLNRSATAAHGQQQARIDRLNQTIQALRKDKRGLNSRIIGLKKVRPERRPTPQPAPVIQLADYSGPQGLKAAADEARRHNKARKAA